MPAILGLYTEPADGYIRPKRVQTVYNYHGNVRTDLDRTELAIPAAIFARWHDPPSETVRRSETLWPSDEMSCELNEVQRALEAC